MGGFRWKSDEDMFGQCKGLRLYKCTKARQKVFVHTLDCKWGGVLRFGGPFLCLKIYFMEASMKPSNSFIANDELLFHKVISFLS